MTFPQENKKQLLAERLRKARQHQPGPRSRSADAVVPLGPTQIGLWLEDGMDPGSTAYVVGFGLRIQGPADPQRIRDAYLALRTRYDILRASYPANDQGDPTVVLHEDTGVEIPVTDLRGAGDPLASAEAEFSRMRATPFDVAAGPLARIQTLVLADDDHVVLFTAHHLIIDGWSMELLKSDLRQALEQAVRSGSIDLGACPLQYEDVAVYEASAERVARRERGLAQQVERLAGTRNLELDIARPRPAILSSRGHTHEFTLPTGPVEQLRALAATEGATFYMAMLALYQVLLARHSAQRDFVIGTSVANRDASGVEDVVGNFVNMVAMRSELVDNPTFRELVSRSRETALEAFSTQSVPLNDIVKALALPWAPNNSPLFQVSLAVDELATAVKPVEGQTGELRFSEIGATADVTHFDLGLHVFRDHDGRYVASMTYRTDLFDQTGIETLAARLELLLTRVVADPETRVLDIDVLTDVERGLVTRVWGRGRVRDGGSDCTLYELVRPVSGVDVSRVAVVEGGEGISVGRLHERAGEVARRLAARGVGPEVRVAVALSGAVPAAVSILGVLAAGGVYVPVDPAVPRDRFEYILVDSGAVLCIHDDGFDVGVGVEAVSYDDLLAETLVAEPVVASPDNLAYVIYTSGTTGRPKGVGVEHREITRYLRDVCGELGVVRGGSYALLQSLAFDFSLLMFYLPLMTGGTLHVVDGHVTGEELARFLADHGVDYLKMTPSHLAALVSDVDVASVVPRRGLVLAGEGAPVSWVRDVAAGADCRIVNSYGPTETVVACTIAEVVPDGGVSEVVWPIGVPMPGVRVYVLDDRLCPVPVGVRGELYVAGRVARGYLSRPGLTASRFIADPSGCGERMYRTGDVVSWRSDGQLAFHGRVDDQVKIRGFRVELGEIESVLAGMDGVAQCVVDLRGEAGRERLVGWIRWADETVAVADAEIRDYLACSLPDYMIPRVYASVDEFPMKGHGKIDRSALAEPERGVITDVAPRTELEVRVCDVFADVVGVDGVGPEDDFFLLGGHSLAAMRVVARLGGAGVGLRLRDVFEAPTARALAGRLEALEAAACDDAGGGKPIGGGVVPRVRPEWLPASLAQRRLWTVACVEGASAAYNIPLVSRLRGPLDVVALQEALRDVVERQEVLRTVVTSVDGEPFQQLLGVPEISDLCTVVDVSGLGERERLEVVRQCSARPFDLERDLPVRMWILEEGADSHVLVLVMHHIASDGMSMAPLLGDLRWAYCARVLGVSPSWDPLEVTYADYTLWQHEQVDQGVLAVEVDWWRARLAGVPEETRLPGVLPAVGSGGRPAGVVGVVVPAEVLARLQRLASGCGASVFMVCQAAVAVLLNRLGAGDDVVLGAVTAGRDDPGLEPLVGFFVNTVAIRHDLAGNPTVATVVERARDAILGALDHSRVPFDMVVGAVAPARVPGRHPLFQVMVTHVSETGEASAGIGLPGLEVEDLHPGSLGAKFDLSFKINEVPGPDGTELVVHLEHATDRFDATAAETLLNRLVKILEVFSTDQHTLVSTIDVLTDVERGLVTRVWGRGRVRDGGSDCTLYELVRPVSGVDVSRVAVVEGGEGISVGRLHERAGEVARRLAARGVGPEVRVAVALSGAVPAAVSILGVLAAGGVYVPVDPAVPRDRFEYILVDSGAVLCIHDDGFDVGVGVEAVSYDDLLAETLVAEPVVASPDNLAYVIYTSGTTGRPKGVGVEHREITRYLRDVCGELGVVRGGSYALLQSLAFDFSLLMFYLPLMTGGTLHVVDGHVTGEELARFLADHGVDYLKMTPSHLAALVSDVDVASVVPRRGLVLAGEGAPVSWVRDVAAGADCRIVNSYGPTETVVACTIAEVVPDGGVSEVVWPIGVPMPGVRVYVLDDRLCPVPVGVRGELYVAGRVARGYLSRPGLTASRFIADPSGCGERMYRTGDVVSWRSDGQLAFHGRVDDQVKIRGFRVELGEIESVLAGMDGVAQCVVDLRGEAGRERLVGWIRWADETVAVADAEIRDYLACSLPDYMIPRVYASVDEFPMKGHGKIDRSALAEPERGVITDVAPRTELETELAAVYADLLGIETLSVVADFFDLGGDSLLATRVVARIKPIVGDDVAVSVMDIISNPTVESLARLIEDRRSGDAERRLLYELTKPISAAERVASIVAVPYGGANASVFSDLAGALPTGYSLYSVEPPGHDVALDEDVRPIREVAVSVADEILQRIDGDLIIYGHCVPGSALAAAVAEELTRRGRDIEALYIGGAFPVARPTNKILAALARWSARDWLTSDRNHANWLTGMGADMGAMDEEHAAHMIKAMRQDGRFAEDYFTGIFGHGATRFTAPVISVVGEADQSTRFWEERSDEWSVYSDRVASVCIQDAGHYFLNYRPDELAEIITTVHLRIAERSERTLTRPGRGAEATWWLHDSRIATEKAKPGRQPRLRSVLSAGGESADTLPGLGKFAIITAGQMISFIGSTLTGFALPLWVLSQTNDLVLFGIFGVLAVLPNLIVAPVAGAIVDRFNRRRLIMIFDGICMTLLTVLLLLAVTNTMQLWNMMLMFSLVACAVAFQRVAFQSALPQIVPKRYLGHANGMLQSATGVATFTAPLFGVGMLAIFGVPGILAFDVVSYVFAITTVALIRFPATMPDVSESVWEEIRSGFRFSMRNKYFRSMLLYFALVNLFLAPLLSLVNPLVLALASLNEVAVVAGSAGVAGIVGGVVMSIWGGPRHRRMDAVRIMSLVLAICAFTVASRPSLLLVCVGVFGLSGVIVLVNGTVMTIIQTKVPARIQGRVLAINAMVSTASAPLGFGVLAPQGTRLMEWVMTNVPGAEPVVHTLLGNGPGRAIAMVYAMCGLVVLVLVICTRRWRTLTRFDDEVPDARPDDLIGLAQSRARHEGGADVVRTMEQTGTLELERMRF